RAGRAHDTLPPPDHAGSLVVATSTPPCATTAGEGRRTPSGTFRSRWVFVQVSSSVSAMASRSTPAKKGPSPAAAKTERLLNLVLALLSTRQPLSRARIRLAVPDYADGSDEAFERMFERDKDELRALGIPLRTEPIDPFFDDEPGYRIDQREYALPQIELEPDE